MKSPGLLNRSVVGLGLVAGLLMAGTTVPASAAAGFAVTPTIKNFGSQPIGTNSAAQTFKVTNTGTTPLTIANAALVGPDQSQFDKRADNCSDVTLAPNATCTVNVRFSPTSTGAKSAGFRFFYDAAGSPHTVALSGTGIDPGFGVSPTSKDFGPQRVGTFGLVQTFTVTNTGTTPLTITDTTLVGADPDQFVKGLATCDGANVPPDATCTVRVRFSPTSPGAKTARLRFRDNAAGSPHTVDLSGFGTAPVFAVSPTSMDFGTQPIGTTSASQTFTVTNTGDEALVIAASQLDGADPGQFTEVSDSCTVVVLASTQTCTVTVSFAPTGRGAKTAVLRFTDDAAGSPHDVGLAGFGTAPEFAVSPTSADFGSRAVGSSSAPRTFTVTNTGDAPLVITDALLAGADAGDFTEVTDGCSGQTLAPAATCTVAVAFSPQGYKPKTAVLRFTHNAAGSPTEVTLTGIGTSPPGEDPDNDGVFTRDDNCPNDANPGQADSDGDGFGDPCDNDQRDVDFDNIPGPTDNCPAVSNPGQADSDGDGVGDACDTPNQPSTDKQRINPAIKGKNIRRTGNDWVLVRARAADGAHVRIFKITDRHRRVLVDEGTLNANGVYKTVIDDANARDVTAYKAVVSATSDTLRGVTNRLRQQRSTTR